MDGHLVLLRTDDHLAGYVPLAKTQWNREHNHRTHRLHTNVPWGIVVHWFGDKENFDKNISSYLRGFDSLRQVDDYITRTSAHFLVGENEPTVGIKSPDAPVSILQTQKPDLDGTPFVASHVSGLDYVAHQERRQYFVRALYQLGYEEPGVHSIVQDWFDAGRTIDPNMCTIAIELTGYDFDNPSRYPPKQQIANAISVIWAVMRRYGISANNIFGHNEIQLNKSDPGKKFMGLIRYLLGAKALLENDPLMNLLVFGNFLAENIDTEGAVAKYFKFVYDYLLMISRPITVYEWEALSGFWFLSDLLNNETSPSLIGNRFVTPLLGNYSSPGRLFMQPTNHEGIDLYSPVSVKDSKGQPVTLVASGICLNTGENDGCCGGKYAIFHHRLSNGSQVLSFYGHLDAMYDLKVGQEYPIRIPIGEINKNQEHIDPFVHFALAYGGTWKTDLKNRPTIPLNAGASWVRDRYLNPFALMSEGFGPSPGSYLAC